MARKWWTLGVVSVATFMLLLDITVVNTALPAIREDLGASFTELQWVIDAYALTLAAFVLVAGSLADRLGRRRVFAIGLAIFSVSSLLPPGSPATRRRSTWPAPLQGIGGARDVRGLAGADRPGVPGRPRARPGDGHLRRDDRRRGRRRPARRRRADRRASAGSRSSSSTSRSGCSRSSPPTAASARRATRTSTRIDWGGPRHLQRSASSLLVLALLRGNEEGWGQRLIVGLFIAGARRCSPRSSPSSAACREPMLPLRPVPQAHVHRRPARSVRDLGLDVRAVPLPDALHAELPRPTRRSRPAFATCR